jgi:hypothetical protein
MLGWEWKWWNLHLHGAKRFIRVECVCQAAAALASVPTVDYVRIQPCNCSIAIRLTVVALSRDMEFCINKV